MIRTFVHKLIDFAAEHLLIICYAIIILSLFAVAGTVDFYFNK